jgi:hypothetical protein
MLLFCKGILDSVYFSFLYFIHQQCLNQLIGGGPTSERDIIAIAFNAAVEGVNFPEPV